MAKLRQSRTLNDWALPNLHPLYDPLILQTGCIKPDHRRAKIRSLADAKMAWSANKHLFMKMCGCRTCAARCEDHALSHEAGHRPWAHWVFDLGYSDMPQDQETELRRLGLITPAEQHAIDVRHRPALDAVPGEIIEFLESKESDTDLD